MKSRTQRKVFMAVVLAGIALAGYLTYRALQSNMLYFFSPTQVATGEAPNRTFRLGGMVLAGSLKRERSEERRVGKEGRCRWAQWDHKKKTIKDGGSGESVQC